MDLFGASDAVLDQVRATSRSQPHDRVKAAPISDGARGCDACTLKSEWVRIHSPCMGMRGNTRDPDILVIGEAPGETEDLDNDVFVGPTGKLLRDALPMHDIDRIAFANTVRCRPYDNRVPTDLETFACSLHLEQDLEAHPGIKAILGAGNVPLSRFITETSISSIHGTRFPVQIGSRTLWYFPIFHPSFVLRAQKAGYDDSAPGPVFQADIRRFFREVDRWPKPKIYDLRPEHVHVVYDEAEARSLIATMSHPVAVDVETNKLKPYLIGADILCASFSDGTTSVAFPIHAPDAHTDWGLRLLLDTVCEREWIAHNASFELIWFLALGQGRARDIKPFHDSMALMRLYHERHILLDLGIGSRIHLGVNIKRLTSVDASRINEYPIVQVMPYCGIDSQASALIYRQLINRVNADHYRELLARIKSMTHMELMGLPTSETAAQVLKASLSEQADAARRAASRLYEVKQFQRERSQEFNIASPQQVGTVLAEYGKVELPRTKNGYVTDEDTLLGVAKEHPLVVHTLDYREAQKQESTYIDPVLSVRQTYKDGLIHPSYTVLHVITYRSSSAEPNCFPPEVEVLTDRGWVRWDQVSEGMMLAQYDSVSASIEFARPLELIRQTYNGPLLHISTELHVDITCTPQHELLIGSNKLRRLRKVRADCLPVHGTTPSAGYYVGGAQRLRASQIILIAAMQADAYQSNDCGYISWEFSRRRKITRLRDALTDEGIHFNERIRRDTNQAQFYVPRDSIPSWLADKKHFGSWVLQLDHHSLSLLAHEIWLWDGLSTNSNDFCTGVVSDADWAQIILTLTGRSATVRRRASTPSKTLLVTARNNTYCHIENSVRTSSPYHGNVYCATMPQGTLIVRHNGRVVITGNSQNYPKRKHREVRRVVEAPEGHLICAADYGQMQVRNLAMACAQEFPERNLHNALVSGKDIHTEWLNNLLQLDPNYLEHLARETNETDEKAIRKSGRTIIKSDFVFNSFFGGGVDNIVQRTGLKPDLVKELQNWLWEEFPEVRKYHRARRREYKDTGTVLSLNKMVLGRGVKKGNEMINFPIQNAEAEIVFAAQNELSELSLERGDPYLHPRINVHDDLSFILPDDDRLETYIDTITPIMLKVRFDWQCLPLAVEWSAGPNWCDLEEVVTLTGDYAR